MPILMIRQKYSIELNTLRVENCQEMRYRMNISQITKGYVRHTQSWLHMKFFSLRLGTIRTLTPIPPPPFIQSTKWQIKKVIIQEKQTKASQIAMDQLTAHCLLMTHNIWPHNIPQSIVIRRALCWPKSDVGYLPQLKTEETGNKSICSLTTALCVKT